ncbi:MAG: Xaa-Pro dipeptidase [Gammaproteobacteria bacterium]|nr:Xaa-Pro dipeptidase [Gammaproteobacteria bacterium]MDH3376597.1 Xaa-Pro dipeptidase [Gammaproteobacteria bacterium]
MNYENHYHQHVQYRQHTVEHALAETGYHGLLIHSGRPMPYFADDQYAPFRSTPHFAAWLPARGPGHCLVLRTGQRPRLLHYAAADYWYEPSALDPSFWGAEFDIHEVDSPGALRRALPDTDGFAFIGADEAVARAWGIVTEAVNDNTVRAHLDWGRGTKTAYEIACIEVATERAALAHTAAANEFMDGASELEIHQAYLRALGDTDRDLPYDNIVALDTHAAVLHYQNKRQHRDGALLLIDAGASASGYACDITRTHLRDSATGMASLHAALERLQQTLCAQLQPGISFVDVHRQAHRLAAELLCELELLSCSAQQAFDNGYTRPFLPHGLGHLLGVQVHDVGGHQHSANGAIGAPPAEYPALRLTRCLAPGMVLTIEPGIYVIDQLLQPFRESGNSAFAWPAIDRLRPYGGVRIEDNVVITPSGHRNITREYLA